MGSFFYIISPKIYVNTFFKDDTYSWGDCPTTSLKQLKNGV